VIGGTWLLLSITAAEALTPGYNVSNEAISGLGSPIFSTVCNDVPSCVTLVPPASAIFVFALFLSGMLWLLSGLILRRATDHRRFALAISVVGVAYVLVGATYLPFYPGGTSAGVVGGARVLHLIAALVIFVLGPAVVISSYRFTRAPLRYVWLGMGAFNLAALLLFASANYLGLGFGGIERMVVYPIFLWGIGLGASLLEAPNRTLGSNAPHPS
jgi:hypothetical membrane protein